MTSNRWLVLAVVSAVGTIVNSTGTVGCPLFRATYAPAGRSADTQPSSYRIRHIESKRTHDLKARESNQANYILQVVEQQQKKSFDFGFAFPNGSGGIQLIFLGQSEAAPLTRAKGKGPQSTILYFGSDLKLAANDTDGTNPAPSYLLMPEMEAAFWYWRVGEGFVPPAGLWRLESCDN